MVGFFQVFYRLALAEVAPRQPSPFEQAQQQLLGRLLEAGELVKGGGD